MTGEASVIEDEGLARRVASITGGKVLEVYESHSASKVDVETGKEEDRVTETVSVSKFLEVLRGKDY